MKFHAYSSAYIIASNGYLQLSTLISNALDDEIISDAEFTTMTSLYNTVTSSLEKDFLLKTHNNDNNVNDVVDSVHATVTSTDHNKYNPVAPSITFSDVETARVRN